MLRAASRSLLRGALRQVGRVPFTRKALHALSVASRGAGVAVLRARRLLPDTALGRRHQDWSAGALTPAALKRELRDAQGTLDFVHLAEAVAVLERGDRLERGLAVLTFDESFAATVELALPVLRELGVPATIFVTTGFLDPGTPGVFHATLWDEAVRCAVEQHAPRPLAVSWIDRVLRTETAAKRRAATRRLLLSLAALDEERLERRLGELFQRTGGTPPCAPLDRMLGRFELAELCKEPLLSFGAHGERHLALANATASALQDEMVRPREVLQQLCGASFADVVSYPFGRSPYVDDRAVLAARAAGYRAALGAEPGVARPGDHLYRLPRLPIGPGTSGIAAYELQGTFDAVDEIVLVASGDRTRLDASLQG